MVNPGTGLDDVKYFAFTVVMAGYMAPEHRAEYRKRTLGALVRAVFDEAARRVECRDRSVAAAKRVRAWEMGAELRFLPVD